MALELMDRSGSGGEAEVQQRVERMLTARLVAPQRNALAANVVAMAAIAAVFWGVAPHQGLLSWAGILALALTVRGVVNRRAAATGSDERTRQTIRMTTAVTALVWGAGAAVLLRYLPTAYGVLLVSVLVVLVAGSATTLVADVVAFRLYATGILLPVAAALALVGRDRVDLIVSLLMPLFALPMMVLQEQGHRLLVRQLETAEMLQDALHNVRTLSGLLPICSSCKKIRDDRGYWNQVEVYVRDRTDAEFSHGLCPECARRLYPDLDLDDDAKPA